MNYALSETPWRDFSHGIFDEQQFRKLIKIAMTDDAYNPRFEGHPSEQYTLRGGDGFAQMSNICRGLSMGCNPVLMESPETHLSLLNMRRLASVMRKIGKQIFITTHAPEMVAGNHEIFSLS